MFYQFDGEVAKVVGVERAVLFQNIAYWVTYNKANERNKRNGQYWTYNTGEAYTKLFPFWSRQKIARMLRELEADGFIKSGTFNAIKTDTTKWYTLGAKGNDYWCSRNENWEVQKQTAACSEVDSPLFKNKLPTINTNNKHTDINTNKGGATAPLTSPNSSASFSFEKVTEPELREALLAFRDMRKQIKKPLTLNAEKLCLKKLDKLASSVQEKVAIVEQSTMNSWQGLFPLREEKARRGEETPEDRVADVMAMMKEWDNGGF